MLKNYILDLLQHFVLELIPEVTNAERVAEEEEEF